MIDIFEKHYTRDEVLAMGNWILNSGLIVYQNDATFLREALAKINRNEYLSLGQLKYLKDIFFKYDTSVLELPRFLRLPVDEEDIEWAQNQIALFEATGAYRYRGVAAYKGVAGERVIQKYMRELFPSLELNAPLGEGQEVDEFDFRYGNISCDIKCSTELHYASVTPKVPVENNVPKDYYIGARFDDRNPGQYYVYVIGYLPHTEIVRCKILQKFGAPYYEVSLLRMQRYADLIDVLRRQEDSK